MHLQYHSDLQLRSCDKDIQRQTLKILLVTFLASAKKVCKTSKEQNLPVITSTLFLQYKGNAAPHQEAKWAKETRELRHIIRIQSFGSSLRQNTEFNWFRQRSPIILLALVL